MEILLGFFNQHRLIAECVVFLFYTICFLTYYKSQALHISRTIHEIEASSFYDRIKFINHIIMLIAFCFVVYINLINHDWVFLFASHIIYFIVLFYTNSSLKLLNHFVNFLFRPELNNEQTYYTISGYIEYNKEYSRWVFNHIFSGTEILL